MKKHSHEQGKEKVVKKRASGPSIRLSSLFWLAAGAALGAVAAYVLDPESGERRRAELADRSIEGVKGFVASKFNSLHMH